MMMVPLSDLQSGDRLVEGGLVVADVQRIGSLVIVDFTDGTATAPVPGSTVAEVE